MSDEVRDAGKQSPVVCKNIRTKMAFGSLGPSAPDWREG